MKELSSEKVQVILGILGSQEYKIYSQTSEDLLLEIDGLPLELQGSAIELILTDYRAETTPENTDPIRDDYEIGRIDSFKEIEVYENLVMNLLSACVDFGYSSRETADRILETLSYGDLGDRGRIAIMVNVLRSNLCPFGRDVGGSVRVVTPMERMGLMGMPVDGMILVSDSDFLKEDSTEGLASLLKRVLGFTEGEGSPEFAPYEKCVECTQDCPAAGKLKESE